MKLKELYLQNFRCFESLSVSFHPSLTVIVAENGEGKTTILDAMAVGFGRVLTKLPRIRGIATKDTDLRIGPKSTAPFARYWLSAEDFSQNPICWSGIKRRDSSEATQAEIRRLIANSEKRGAGFKDIDAFVDTLINRHNDNEDYLMPLIVYYGTNRAILEEVKRRRNFRKEFTRFESLTSALESNSQFKAAFEWFNAMEDLERRNQQEQRDFDYTLSELNAVRQAIESMLPGFRHPRTEIRPVRFVIDRQMDDGTTRTFRITQLSDGYRTMLGLVMDLARRMAQANPPHEHETKEGKKITDPLQMPAIVLIDEIDLHLHPKWQQRIVADLRRTFPQVQFIVTTHSPQVLSTVPSECIRILENGSIYSAPPGTEGAEASRLLKRVLGVDTRPPENQATQELKEYLALVDADQWQSQRALVLRNLLDTRYQGEEPALLEADLRIENRKWELEQ